MRTLFAPHPVVRAVAVLMLVIEIAIHAYLAPDHLEEVRYIGLGFVVSSVLLGVVTVALILSARNPRAWLAGAALCVGMGVLFAVSRLFGLPDYHESWTSDAGLGLWSVPPELVFLACAAAARVPNRPVRLSPVGAPAAV